MDAKVSVIDISGGQATVETEGLYRVVFHGDINRKIYRTKEFLDAEEAIDTAERYNSPSHPGYGFAQKRKWWAEAVSYKEWAKRSERCEDERYARERSATTAKSVRAKFKNKISKLKKRLKKSRAKVG